MGKRTGLAIGTELHESEIPGAGLGRFATEAVASGGVLRTQQVGSPNLLAFRTEAELRAAFPLAEDLAMLSDFAYSSTTLPGVVLFDNPPTYVNHANSDRGANTAFRFSGMHKQVLATRDIAAGDELLQDYRAIDAVPWLEWPWAVESFRRRLVYFISGSHTKCTK